MYTSDREYLDSFIIATTFYAAACLVSIYGVVMAVRRWKGLHKSQVMPAIIFCNMMLMVSIAGFEWSRLVDGGVPCLYGGRLQDSAYHLCILTFDAFIIYKAWVIALEDRRIAFVGVFLLLIRLVWGVIDSIKSYGYIDNATGDCMWYNFDTAMYAYMFADIALDLFATVVVVVCCRKIEDTVELSRVLMIENILRSVISLVQGILYILASWNQNIFTYANGIQMFIIALLLNSEFWWSNARTLAYATHLQRKHDREEQLRLRRSQAFAMLSKGEESTEEESTYPSAQYVA